MALEQYGAWSAAQAAYTSMMGRWQQGEAALVNTKASCRCGRTASSARRKLGSGAAHRVCEQTQQPQLLMECSWLSSDWEKLKELFSKYSLPAAAGADAADLRRDPRGQARRGRGALQRRHPLCSLAVVLAPRLCGRVLPTLLQTFQPFQELQESAQMLELSNAQRNGRVPDSSPDRGASVCPTSRKSSLRGTI